MMAERFVDRVREFEPAEHNRSVAGATTPPGNRMAYDEQLATRVRNLFKQRKVAFAEKRMMGGLCFLVADKMCVGVEKERLMVRLDPEIYEQAIRRKGCAPMDFTGRPMRGFVFVKAEGFAAEEDLASWLKLALEFNPKARSSRKRMQGAASEARSQRGN